MIHSKTIEPTMKVFSVHSVLLMAAAGTATALVLDTTDVASIKSAASTIAYGMMSYYTGNITDTASTIAVLPSPYYWWEAGAMWGAMIDYWHFTGDASYNDVVYQALVSQVGPDYDFMLAAQEFDEGNDDQSFWGFAAMSAAEKGFPEPPSPTPSWLTIVENLFNDQVARWGLGGCGGGLKWQIYPSNNGYDYKNSVSNGAFFQLAARLGRYTGNQTYLDWAEKIFDWSINVGFIDASWNVYDGTDDTTNCTTINHVAWSYGVGIYLYGSAVMYNYTNASSLWETRTDGLLQATKTFFNPFSNATDIMYEFACEPYGDCDTDEYSFKAYLARFMWGAAQLAPFTQPKVSTLLTTSAAAAAVACSGHGNSTCGQKWYVGGYDGTAGVGQQMSALELIQGLLVNETAPPSYSPQVHIAAAPVAVSSSSTTTYVASPVVTVISTSGTVKTETVTPTINNAGITSSDVSPTSTSTTTKTSSASVSTASTSSATSWSTIRASTTAILVAGAIVALHLRNFAESLVSDIV